MTCLVLVINRFIEKIEDKMLKPQFFYNFKFKVPNFDLKLLLFCFSLILICNCIGTFIHKFNNNLIYTVHKFN